MGCGDKEQGSSFQDRVSHLYTLRFRLEYKFYLIQKKVKKERRDLIQILNSEHHH